MSGAEGPSDAPESPRANHPSKAIRPGRASVWFVLVVIVLDMMALGIILPVLPKLVEQMAGGDVSQAAMVYGLFGASWALMQLIFSPIIGALSDRFGRKPIIVLSALGLGLDHILMALAPNLFILWIGRLLSGITAASFSTASAYIADITPPEERAARFGMIGAAFGLGFILGPAIGGLLGQTDPRLPFWVAAGLSLTTFVYGAFLLPESLPRENRTPFTLAKANPWGSLRLLRSTPRLTQFATVYFLIHVATMSFPAVYVLYAGHRLGWGPAEVGLALAGVGVCTAVVEGFLVRPAVARIGEPRCLILGLLAGAAGFVIYAFAHNALMMMIGIPVMALWGLATAALASVMTREVDARQQGQLQGANSSLMGFGSLIAPLMFTQTFALAIAPSMPWWAAGAPFMLAALLLLLATGFARRGLAFAPRDDDKTAP
ncbi:MAG: TCR/Tet family MFS transporter [Pseudomonadota bacterium]